MRTLHELGEFVGIPQDVDDLYRSSEIRLRRVGYILSGKGRLPALLSFKQMIVAADALPTTPLTLDAKSRVDGNHVFIRVFASEGGFVLSTKTTPSLAAGIGGHIPSAIETTDTEDEYVLGTFPVSLWKLTVKRTGLTNRGYGSIEKVVFAKVEAPPVVEPNPPDAIAPTITVSESGPPERTMYNVSGIGFLPEQPDNQFGISIRAVDGVNNQDFIYIFTGSDKEGKITKLLGPLDRRSLARDAVGEARLHFSATDSRKKNGQPLWSNIVTFRY